MMDWLIELFESPLVSATIGAAGALLTTYYLPLRLKRKEWEYEKETWAKEFIFENISFIAFLSEEYFKGENDDHISLSCLSMKDTNEQILNTFSLLSKNAHKIEIYADDNSIKTFKEFVSKVALEYSAAKESWGMWDQDDEISEIRHCENTIYSIGVLAGDSVKKIKGHS